MAKRKTSWGPSNPLWRWQHRKSSSNKRTTKRGLSTMARRKRKFSFRKARSFLGNEMLSNTVLPAMAYGAVREKLSIMADPITSKLPFGAIADEVGLGAGLYFIAKKNYFGLGKIARAGLALESARVGEALVKGQVSWSGNGAPSSSGVPIV